jgi:F-type H+-transporting ATPase subunit b
VLTAVVTSPVSEIEIVFARGVVAAVEADAEEGAEGPESDLNPIFPETKEVVWGFGAFVVLALALRLVLFRKVRDGMDARYAKVTGDREDAEATKAAARAEVAEYEAELAAVRADAHRLVDEARATLEAERTEQLAAANARVAERRAAAAAEVDAARAAASADVEAAVGAVASRAGELAIGRAPSPDAVANAVRAAMRNGVPA